MKRRLTCIALLVLCTATSAFAEDDDCRSPMADWKSREAVTAYAKELGIVVARLRIDDGCYEVRGRDSDGNRVELKIDPSSLALMRLSIHFQPGAKPSRYLPGARAMTSMDRPMPHSDKRRAGLHERSKSPAVTTTIE